MRLGARVAAVVLLGSLAACGQESGTPAADGETSAAEARPPGGPDLAGPPPLTLHRPEGDVDLEAHTWCYHDENGAGCADGPRPDDPPHTSGDGPLTFSFPLEGWRFSVDFRRPGPPDSCLRSPPSREDGDEQGALAPSLHLFGLDVEPRDATAVLVLSDGSTSETYPMEVRREDGCPDDGALGFMGAKPTEPLQLPDLGEPPWSYEVHLVMDRTSYVGTGRWPDDLTPPLSNQVPLTWSPPPPGWDGS